MRIHTCVEFEWSEELQQYVVAHEEGYDYEGPVEHAGGGPSQQQKDAAASEAALNAKTAAQGDAMVAREGDQYAAIKPYAMDRINNGLPFMGSMLDQQGGSTARSFAPLRAQVARTAAKFGGSLPSGYADQAMTDVGSAQARAYDDALYGRAMDNENAKAGAAGLLTGEQQIANPIGWYSATTAGNNSIMQAPLATPGIGGILGGVLQGAAGSAMTAFCPAAGSLITKADGTKDVVELMVQHDGAAQLNAKASHLIDTPQPVLQACVEVVTESGKIGTVGIMHCYVLESGGYCFAFECAGQVLKGEDGPEVVKEVNVAGFRPVYPIHVGGNHTYCADGLWSLE